MKRLFTLLFVACCTIAQAQQITTAEYFFDTDPGIGNATAITLNSSDLNTSLDFNVAGLSSGVHIVNVRIKNSDNAWSTTYRSGILISNGTAGDASITAAEYFFDTDPGIGKGIRLPINKPALDEVINFDLSNLAAGPHTMYVRLKNNANDWSFAYQGTFILSNGAAGDASITAAEYFFDTDPGIGKGIRLPINKPALDEKVDFDVSGLTAGQHTLYVRLKNSANTWSFAAQGTFLLSTGAGGDAQIKTLEYFTDIDSGVARNTIIELPGNATLDTTISVPVADNGGDSTILGIRLGVQSGHIGNVALATVSLCELYKPVSGFRAARFGNSYAFSDSSLLNDTKQLRWLVDNVADTNYNNSRIFNYAFPNDFVGTKTVTQIAGAGCRVDTSAFEIQMQGVEYITPYRALTGRDYVMQVFGGGLDSLTELTLTNGSTIVKPFDIASYQGKMLSAIFDFHNISTRSIIDDEDYYDLHIHFSNGRDTVLQKAVILINPGACELASFLVGNRKPQCENIKEDDYSFITTDLSGPGSVRLGSWNYYTMHVTNGGSGLVKETPAWLIIPANYDVQFDINWDIADTIKNVLDSFPADDYLAIDTVIDGKHMQYKMYGLVPPFIEPGQTWDINFKIRSSQVTEDKIIYWVQKPMFGSGMRPGWKDCAWDLLGYTPLGCVTGAYDYFTKKAGFDANYHSDFSHGILRGALKDAKNFGLTLAGVATSCGGVAKAAAKKVTAEILAKITFWEAKVADRTISTINNDILANCRNLDITQIKKDIIHTVFGFDPNSLSGNNDYDSSLHYINNYSPQHYTVNFENKPSATASTQHVFITDTLSRDKFIFSSFNFNGYRIGDSVYSVPPLRSQLFQTSGIKYDQNLQVRFSASFDTATGILRADYYSLEKDGNRLISDTSLRGFLPPNTDGISGTGSLSFSIYARNLNTLDTFSNKAYIYFDSNEPIATNTWQNTVDTTAPTGKIVNAVRVNDSTVQLQLQHGDIGSGFDYNQFFVKAATDSVFRYLGNSGSDTVLFKGELNQTYQFYVKAIDNVGNAQKKDAVADVSYTFSNALPVHLLSFSASKEDSKVKLQWISVSENNLNSYVAEKSADGVSFTSLDTVIARGGPFNNNYQLYDEHPLPTTNYYRLKQLDKSGGFTYSRIVRVDFDKASAVTVIPTPAHDYITINGVQNFSQVQIIDMKGRVVKQFKTPAGNVFNIQELPSGIYMIRLAGDNKTQTLKMIKQ